ncbi:MAG: hypothetical protein HKN00_08710 [Flavobacteriaceae bacterium]|nr:hypothetical protein [Bacteroidia bacterium]MBT8287592.1 hypothetical protein [Bacteroidia bacterium]NNF75249.1 hypothetical protein [Flavobacteriaceae bacterium]NNK74304.1 hypothetical protein [Flavobacteriaceae bacterium]
MKTRFISIVLLCMALSVQVNAQDQKSIMQSMMGGKKVDASKLQDVYQFEWEYKTVMKSNKETMKMNYLINPDSDYFGMQISSKEYQQMDFMCIITDPKADIIATFMSAGGRSMGMLSPIKEEKSKKSGPKYGYKEIGTKEILGYESYGIEIENEDYVGTIYFTLDAPVSFSALFSASKNKSAPKGFDPALMEVLEEDALIMEMDFIHKKKKKQSFTMTAVSLEKKQTQIKTKDYPIMGY